MTVLYAGPADTQYDGVSFDMGLERQGTQPKDAIMLFSVIYSVDVPQDEDILSFAPPTSRISGRRLKTIPNTSTPTWKAVGQRGTTASGASC